jgi:uncharacterized repeat protein (TIGR04052 family)
MHTRSRPQGFGSSVAAALALALALALAATAAGCEDDDHDHVHKTTDDTGADSAMPESDGAVDAAQDGGMVMDAGPDPLQSISFAGVVGTTPFSCTQSYAGIGTSNASITPVDFRLYVSDVVLTADDGKKVPFDLEPDGIFQSSKVALLDFEDRTGGCNNGTEALHTKLVGRAPAGKYTGITFTIGVPEALNHQNAATAEAPLNLSGLFWNWQGGYKFLRLDGKVPSTNSGFVMHLGSTGCTAGATPDSYVCTKRNAATVTLTADPFAATFLADWKALLAGVAIDADQGGMPGCMSGDTDPECTPMLGALGIDVTTGNSTKPQTFFRVSP